MSLVVTVVTTPPVIDTFTTSVVPWTTSPFVGESSVIFTGVEGRWPSPPTGVGYGVGAGVPEGPSAVAELHAVRQASVAVRRTSNGRRIVSSVPCPAHYAQRHPQVIQQGMAFSGRSVVGREEAGDTLLSLPAPSFAQSNYRARSGAVKFAGCRPPPPALHPLRHFRLAEGKLPSLAPDHRRRTTGCRRSNQPPPARPPRGRDSAQLTVSAGGTWPVARR